MTPAQRDGSIEIGDRRLAWAAAGSGPPLLLINGYASTGADWDPTMLARLGLDFEVIRPDNRGMGGSDLGSEPLGVEAMAADMEALLDALGLERLPVVGWSMGGFVAQRLAQRAPARVAALALLSTDPGGAAAIPADGDVWARLTDHSGTPREQATRLLSLLFPAPIAAQVDREFGEVVASARAELSGAALRAQEEAMAAWHADRQSPVAADPPPVLVMHGDQDIVIPALNARALASRWRGARTEIFAGGGHAFMAQEPQRVADLLASFFAGPA